MVYNVSDGRVYKSFVPLVASSHFDIIKEERRIHISTTKRPSSYGDGVCVLTYYCIPSGFYCMPFCLLRGAVFYLLYLVWYLRLWLKNNSPNSTQCFGLFLSTVQISNKIPVCSEPESMSTTFCHYVDHFFQP